MARRGGVLLNLFLPSQDQMSILLAVFNPEILSSVKTSIVKIKKRKVLSSERLHFVSSSNILHQKLIKGFLDKLNTESPNDPAIPLLDIYSKELKMGVQAKRAHKGPKQFYSH